MFLLSLYRDETYLDTNVLDITIKHNKYTLN